MGKQRNSLTLDAAARQLGLSVDELSLMLEPGATSVTVDELEHLVSQVASRKNQSLVVSKQNALSEESIEEVSGNVTDYVDAGFSLPALDVTAARAFFDQYRLRQAQELGKLNADVVYDLQAQEQELAVEANDKRNTHYLNELQASTRALQEKTKALQGLREIRRSEVKSSMSEVVSELPSATQELLKQSPLYSHLFKEV